MFIHQASDSKLLKELVHFAGLIHPLLELPESFGIFLGSGHDGFDLFESDPGDADASGDDVPRFSFGAGVRQSFPKVAVYAR